MANIIATCSPLDHLIISSNFVKIQADTRRITLKTDEIKTSNLSDIVRKGSVFAKCHKNIKKLTLALIGFTPNECEEINPLSCNSSKIYKKLYRLD